MYWFSQSDLAAAEAWWRRALELDPSNQRAHECLRLLQRTSSTGFKQDSWARLPAVSGVAAESDDLDVFSDPERPARLPATGSYDELTPNPSKTETRWGGRLPPPLDKDPAAAEESSGVRPRPVSWSDGVPEDAVGRPWTRERTFDALLRDGEGPTAPLPLEPEPVPVVDRRSATDEILAAALEAEEGVEHRLDDLASSSDIRVSGATNLRNFISEVASRDTESSEAATWDVESSSPELTTSGVGSPWDLGPSRTSVLTLKTGGEFDAVAEPTPLPEVDRERFFNRGDPTSKDEIVDFLRATGDLPIDDHSLPSIDLVDPAGPLGNDSDDVGALQDAVATEPATSVRSASPELALQLAKDRFQLHDFQGVLEALEGYPLDPEGTGEVRNMLAESRANLLKMYEAKIGSLDQVPKVLVSSEEVIWLNLNHRAGFILSQVDGTVSYEDLISLSGMPRLDTVRILTELLDQNVIGVG